MTTTETQAGTPVIEFTDDEFVAYLDAEIQRATAYPNLEAFRLAFESGELDDDDPGVERVLPLLLAVSDG
jgi:hypothetical protein